MEKLVKRGIEKSRIGTVVSDKMEKTVIVEVLRRVKHPVFKKFFNKRRKFYAHDESVGAKTGDTVRIKETRPISRLKRWKVVEILKKGGGEIDLPAGVAQNNGV